MSTVFKKLIAFIILSPIFLVVGVVLLALIPVFLLWELIEWSSDTLFPNTSYEAQLKAEKIKLENE